MTPRVKVALSRLTAFSLTVEQAGVMDGRIAEAVLVHIDRVNVYKPLREQMESLARDAYFQGLMDGAHLGVKL